MRAKNIFIAALLIFNCQLSFAQYSNVHDFDGTNGIAPYGTLISDGTFLYGMTVLGGINNMGTIFKIMPDGTGYANLFDFAGAANGSYPQGSLIYDGTFLYGMTTKGGSNDSGTMFKIMPNGTGYVNLHNFSGTPDGSSPYGSLFFDGTFLYGMTVFGGTNNMGTIFKMMPNGTGYVNLLNFSGVANGREPYGSLISDGTFLYGMASRGGTIDEGVLFKIMPNGTGYIKLLDFAYSTNGAFPFGSLISDGTFLYGMTQQGGTAGNGTVFKIMPNGTNYTNLLNFNGTNGNGPYIGCSLISDGTFLYGMTTEGGPIGSGNIFKILPNGTGYANLLEFTSNADGRWPYGSLISDGTFLYGMTSSGSTYDLGTIFKYNMYCTPVTFTWSPTVCAGGSVTVGTNTYNFSGTYSDVFPLVSNGCDSTVITNLTVNSVIDTSATINVFTITSNASGAAYQWIDCNNGNAVIPGETNQSFTATVSGLYAVIVTENGCSDTSSCYNVTITAIIENTVGNILFVYPNPCNGNFFVIANEAKKCHLEIYDVLGNLIFSTELRTTNTEVDLQSKPKGIYFVKLIAEDKTCLQKIIID